jgi:lambda family phage portal protein
MGATIFRFEEKGSRILREWNEARRMERRLQGRASQQLRTAGFAGAAVDRLTASMAQFSGAVNADLDAGLVILRSRARDLAANTEHGRRFLSLVAANVVGTGPKLQVRARNLNGSLDKAGNDAIEVHWTRWGRSADIGGRMGFAHFLRVLTKSVARDGEALVRVIRNRKLPYGIALQLLEADRLDEAVNGKASNGNQIRQGVEIDSTGRPIAYYVKTSHPGENWQSRPADAERVSANDIYHVFVQERAEQVRGYTWFHAVLKRVAMLHAFEEAAVVAARVGASKMGVFTRKEEAASTLESVADARTSDGTLQMNAEPGEFVELPAGYELSSWDPEYPHANFESFVKACMRGVAAGLDVATHNLSGDMTEVNYSSARIAELSERDLWTGLQDWLSDHFLVPLYQDWLESALLLGQVTMEKSGKALPSERMQKFMDVSRFQARRWQWVDPLKEVEANIKAIEAGLVSRTEVVAGQGREYEDVIDEIAQEAAYAKLMGVELTAHDEPSGEVNGGSNTGADIPNDDKKTDAKDRIAKQKEPIFEPHFEVVMPADERVSKIIEQLACQQNKILQDISSVVSSLKQTVVPAMETAMSGGRAYATVVQKSTSEEAHSLTEAQPAAAVTGQTDQPTLPESGLESSPPSQEQEEEEVTHSGPASATAKNPKQSLPDRSCTETPQAADASSGQPVEQASQKSITQPKRTSGEA